jgi:flagellar assembly protein FliH
MTNFIPKEKLTAYQRWEVAAFDEEQRRPTSAAQRRRRSRAGSGRPKSKQNPKTAAVLPTAADIERMHSEAHEPATQPATPKVSPRRAQVERPSRR